jgi:hypothetical protein
MRQPERALHVPRVSRPVVATRQLATKTLPALRQERIEREPLPDAPTTFQPDPYVDYGRFLTREGGVLIIYKDLDLRWRHTIWRVLAWSTFTGAEGWLLLTHSPVHRAWINIVCLLGMAIVNWLIVAKPVELYRRVELRPDCMILEGRDVFWSRFMENGWPAFRPDEEGNFVLCGHYGTRFVEFLTARRFDEFDRMPEVFAAHIREAMLQLWTVPPV